MERDEPPIPVTMALKKLGEDLRDARRRRRIPTAVMAERLGVSRTTLHHLERGEPTVGMGALASAMYVLGLRERFADMADARFDETGLTLDAERLPQRIRTKRNV